MGFEGSIYSLAARDKVLAGEASGEAYARPYLRAHLNASAAPRAKGPRREQAKMDDFLTPETVLTDLKHTAIWGGLDGDGIARLAHHALFLSGRGHAEITPLLAAFYPEYANRVGDARRTQVFNRIRTLVFEGALQPEVLLHFLWHDPERSIVSAAARDVACLDLIEEPGGSRGADWVLKLVVTGSVTNSGAALGGLLALGDEGVNGKLAVLRPGLALPWADRALGQMASCATGCVFASTIEFWLEWMESLAVELPDTARVFDWTAHAVAVQRHSMIESIVVGGSLRGCAAAQRVVPWREMSVADFGKAVSARLRALGPRAQQSESFGRALAAWHGPREATNNKPRLVPNS